MLDKILGGFITLALAVCWVMWGHALMKDPYAFTDYMHAFFFAVSFSINAMMTWLVFE